METEVTAPHSLVQRLLTAVFRTISRLFFKSMVRPPFPIAWQRLVVRILSKITLSNQRGLTIKPLIGVTCGGDVIRPVSQEISSAVMYLHGGGFCVGSPPCYRSITTYIASHSQSEVWVPDYRLAPEYPAPAALDDAMDCYRCMLKAGYKADQIVLVGDSAGAGLVLSMMQKLRNHALPLPAGIVLISPFVDLSLTGESFFVNQRLDPLLSHSFLRHGALLYAGHGQLRNPLYSPLHGEFSDLPAMLIQVGSDEVLLDDAKRLASLATAQGSTVRLTIYLGMWHVFHILAGWLQISDQALDQVVLFIDKCRRAKSR